MRCSHQKDKPIMKTDSTPQLSWSQETYLKVSRFAAERHNGQLFPGKDELPYLYHLTLVAMEVIAALDVEPAIPRNGELTLTCALLHDTIEDTETTYEEIEQTFGKAVAEGVLALTKDEKLPKADRMTDSLQRILAQPPEIAMVKLADRITNLQPPPAHWTPEKCARYLEEAKLIYDALHEASPFLADRLQQKMQSYRIYTTK